MICETYDELFVCLVFVNTLKLLLILLAVVGLVDCLGITDFNGIFKFCRFFFFTLQLFALNQIFVALFHFFLNTTCRLTKKMKLKPKIMLISEYGVDIYLCIFVIFTLYLYNKIFENILCCL